MRIVRDRLPSASPSRPRSGRGFAALAGIAIVVGLLTACDPTPVVLQGRLTTSGSGAPVGAAKVRVYANHAETLVAETTSSWAGEFSFHQSGLTAGTYRIRFGDGAWWPDAGSWADAEPVVVGGSAATTADATIEAVAFLSGTVVDHESDPVGSAIVVPVRTSDGRAVTASVSDDSGAFTLPLTAAGSYRVVVIDTTGSWPQITVGGPTPTVFTAPAGNTSTGTIDITTGLSPTTSSSATTRVSVASGGVQADNSSSEPSVSADGRYTAFNSLASNLVAGDTNNTSDVFVHDRQTNTTTRISVSTGGTQANSTSRQAAISADGRYVAFESFASNLVPGDTNSSYDVFVHDRQTGTTTRVSVATGGAQGGNGSSQASISADGRFVAFYSHAPNLVAGDTNFTADVFVHDRQTATTSRVSVATDGTQTGHDSSQPAISADGRFVAFNSAATNLVAGDTNAKPDVFVHDRQTATTTRVSVATGGAQANDISHEPSISADGRFVAFSSAASALVAGDTNSRSDVFVHDRQTATTTRVSVAGAGSEANEASQEPSISADGRLVAYHSVASNLIAGDTNATTDVFVHDRQSGGVARASVSGTGAQVIGTLDGPAIAPDGSRVAFHSGATTLVEGDTNGAADVFIRKL